MHSSVCVFTRAYVFATTRDVLSSTPVKTRRPTYTSLSPNDDHHWCTQVWIILEVVPSPTDKDRPTRTSGQIFDHHLYFGQSLELETREDPVRLECAMVEGHETQVQLRFNFRKQIDKIPEFSGPWKARELGMVFCEDAIEVRNVYRHATLSSADICERNQPSPRDPLFFYQR